jgi:tellurite resistance protein
MEGFLVIIAIVIGWATFKAFLSAGAKAVGAAGKAVLGKGTFSENMDLAFKGMQEFQVQFKDTRLNDDGSGPLVKEIEGKGLFPLLRKTNVGFVISVFDATSEELAPVLSVIDTFQEEDSIVYQHGTAIGGIELNQGFVRWVRVGVVIPDMLQPPYAGKRKLVVIARMVDLDNMPNIEHGCHSQGDEGIIWQSSLSFEWTFDEKGYLEASEHHDEAVGLSLKIGMAVAMADGSLDDEEGNVLKQWIMKSIDPFADDRKEYLKGLYNEAMKESYTEAKKGDLSLSLLTSRLNEIGDKSDKYETLELCFEVMAADGVAEDNELIVIKNVAHALGLDMGEVAKMRDQKILNLSTNVSGQASIESILGIEPDWSSEQVMKHLRVEFQKWNNRLNTLEEGEERENAQLMLDRIAEARKKYAS